MNERILELKSQCFYETREGRNAFESFTVTRFDTEKFAKLIAQECADICMEMAAKCAGLPGDGALAKDCAYWIKHDFGVE